MRGHENIIALRNQGLIPAGHVRLVDYPVREELLRWSYADDGKYPTVCTAGDAVDSLDLRFLVALPVHILGDDFKRVQRLAQMARAAGAAMVACVTGDKAAIWKKGDAKWLSF